MRFQPDTWLDAVMRPLEMASADGGVYVEIMAPDFRFAFALALAGLLAGMALLRRSRPQPGASVRVVLVLLAILAVTFAVWLATSGNGRYYVVGLLLVGPVCVGLTCLLPLTRAMRLALVVGMLGVQGFAVQQVAPWNAWTYARWSQAPYFHVDIPPDLRAQPATYVTLSAISYSLLAPQFHPGSRWISLHNAPTARSGTPDALRAQKLLERAVGDRLLLVPALAGMLTSDRLPTDAAAAGIDKQLMRHRLRLVQPRSCRFLPSRGLAGMGLGEKTPLEQAQSGFWACHLARTGAAGDASPLEVQHDAAFRALETQCPRFFPAGGDGENVPLPNGAVRTYHNGDVKAYAYDSGEVYYKYYRAMNPVLVGRADDLLAGRLRLDCDSVRARAAAQ